MKPLAPNTLLQNRYLIVHLIGKGGMGEVYLAVDQRLGSAMALKRTTVGDDPMLAEAFEREAKTLANLRHPVLPKVSDHFVEKDEQYLVMEHISGDDLSQRLKTSEKPFPLNWVMFWADQLLEALHYLHTNEPPIIHRDIKPQNLKLTDDNHIVLLDFGLSKQALGQTRLTTSGSVVGYTPHYAPMEQIRGTGTSPRSDIYSLSATLYQLLTSTVPPDSLTRADSLLANLPDPIKSIDELNAEVPKSISDIILQGMEISQEKRHESARDMQKSLRRAFNKVQNSMSAETVAFNTDDIELPEKVGEKTEVISDVPPIPVESIPSDSVSEPEVQSSPMAQMDSVEEDVSAQKTEVIDSSEIPSIPEVSEVNNDLDATVQVNAEDLPIAEANDDAIGMETEVLLDNALPTNEQNVVNETSNDFATSDDYSDIPSAIPDDPDFKTSAGVNVKDTSNAEDFSTSDGFTNEGGEDFAPEATVPLISLEDQVNVDSESADSEVQSETTDFSSFENDSVKGQEEVGDKTTDFALTNDFNESEEFSDVTEDSQEKIAPQEDQEKAVAAAAIPPTSKSSTGKYIAILGGLGLVLVLLLGSALGVGWYMYGGSTGAGTNDANTNPTPQPSVEPTPEPTPDIVESNTIDENVNTDSNTNTGEDLANTNTETNTEEQPDSPSTPTGTKKTTVTTSGSRTKPASTPVRRSTPRPTPRVVTRKTPVKKPPRKPTPKKTPKKRGGRTDIIQ